MSIRVGKERNFAIAGGAQTSERSFTCQQLILILPFLWMSCSSLQEKRYKVFSFSDLLGGICLQGEGRGKLEVSNKTYMFGYESFLEEKGFILAVDFPFQKEKFLKFDFKEKNSGVKGEVYQRLLQNFDNQPRLRTELEKFLISLKYLLESLYSCRADSRGKNCFMNRLKEMWAVNVDGSEGQLIFSHFPYGEKTRGVIFKNFKIKSGYFRRQKIDILFSNNKLTLEFFINSCSVK